METTPKIQKSLSVLCTPGDDFDAVVHPLPSRERVGGNAVKIKSNGRFSRYLNAWLEIQFQKDWMS